ncbi:hypothetical protein [Macrococcus equipercicus]|uniref:Uncharacterized protein n=1 Tax=Macrococcus equipercicus TaxID=69967 RepID=A0A9Q9F0M8_9STAP|nr:hypothetical protein [Macrococcus equipercicus]UTH13123.1 hypothetical protein KFV11_07550 [Macrococcus equipercicus]
MEEKSNKSGDKVLMFFMALLGISFIVNNLTPYKIGIVGDIAVFGIAITIIVLSWVERSTVKVMLSFVFLLVIIIINIGIRI